MAYAARSRRTTAVLAAVSLGLVALTACEGDTDTAAPSASVSSPAAGDTGADKGSGTPSTSDPGDGGTGGGDTTGGGSTGGGGTSAPTEPGSDDGQDGGVGMCETTDLTYVVTVASKPVNHALLTATNKSADSCLLPANELVLTIPTLDGAAGHMGPEGKDWILKTGETAYAGILFSHADTAGGKSADKVEIALTAAESPATVSIGGGPVNVNDPEVTTFFGTAEDALTY
ncbi:DUF4232 domain-containing protein [Streptomyces sp. NPDC058739]|uniref:DUF4232 domain-containing protein n=1 Tax=Streptomyces sp. NPDC058739 TaxID=3346618 RepID=UPI00367943FC